MSIQENPASFLDTILQCAQVQLLQVEESKPPPAPARPVVVVHAGAEDVCADRRTEDLEAVKATAVAAYGLLLNKVRGLEVTEHAIKQLETCYRQQCEKKAKCRCQCGEIQLEADSGIIDQNNLKSGFVGGVQGFEHPITLAKYVLQKTDHIIIVGEGTKRLAKQLNDEIEKEEEDGCFICPDLVLSKSDTTLMNSSEQSDACPSNESNSSKENEDAEIQTENDIDTNFTYKLKTFGVTVYDTERRLSCGTTVFRNNPKDFGRLSATGTVLGCGLASDEHGGCVSVSGLQDPTVYLRAPAHGLVEALLCSAEEDGAKKAALEREVADLGDKQAGAISIDADGVPRVVFTVRSFPWAYCSKNMLFYGCASDDFQCQKLEEPQTGSFCSDQEEPFALE